MLFMVVVGPLWTNDLPHDPSRQPGLLVLAKG